MLDGGSLASQSSQHFRDVPQYCSFVNSLFMDVFVSQVLKGLPYLHLNTFGCLVICVVQTRVLFLSLSVCGRGNLSVYNEGLQQCWKEAAG